jgi:hypothetical protein
MGVRFPLPAPSNPFTAIFCEQRDDPRKSFRYKYGTARITLIFNTLKIMALRLGQHFDSLYI